MKIHLIHNPRSGGPRRNARVLTLLRERLAASPAGLELSVTTGPGDATELARRAVRAGCDRVVAVGGDGTMNEVAQGLLHTPVALALVPTGSGNGLARHLRLPAEPRAALALAIEPGSRVAVIDSGAANGRPFFNVMGLGFDAEVSWRFGRSGLRGPAGYAGAILSALLHRRSERYLVIAGPDRMTGDYLLLAFANSEQYGNGAVIAPGARVDDGLLDFVAVPPLGPLGALAAGLRLFRGTIDRTPGVRRLRAARFLVARPAPGLIHTDGECHAEAAQVEIATVPASLRIVVPPGFSGVGP